MPNKLKPIRRMVLVEPVDVERTEERGLYLGDKSRFPTSGFVYEKSRGVRAGFEVGDFVVFDEHGVNHNGITQDTFILRLQDGQGTHFIRCDTDIEPVIREYESKYRRTGEVRKITVQDLDRDKEQVRFLSSEIVDYGIGSYTDSGYSLSYRHHQLLHPVDTRLDHPVLMLVPEREILFYIKRDDLRKQRGADSIVHRIREEV